MLLKKKYSFKELKSLSFKEKIKSFFLIIIYNFNNFI